MKMISEEYWKLRRWIDELERVDQELNRKYKIENISFDDQQFNDLFRKAKNLREKILHFISEKDYLIADQNLARKCRKIINREMFFNELEEITIEEIIKLIKEAFPDEDIPNIIPRHDDANDIIKTLEEGEGHFEIELYYYKDDRNEYLYNLFNDLFDMANNIKKRRQSLGTLIIARELREEYKDHLLEIKNCFALGLYKSAIVWCRAILELAIYDFLKKRGVLNDREAEDISNFKFNLNKIRQFIDKKIFNKIDNVRKTVNKLLHEKARISIDSAFAYHCIRDTFYILENIL